VIVLCLDNIKASRFLCIGRLPIYVNFNILQKSADTIRLCARKNESKGSRQQFNTLFSKYGFDAQKDIAGIILNRWGHAYLSPQPGFFFGKDGQPAPREVLRRAPFGRIAFANTDLAGAMDHRFSILEAQASCESATGSGFGGVGLFGRRIALKVEGLC